MWSSMVWKLSNDWKTLDQKDYDTIIHRILIVVIPLYGSMSLCTPPVPSNLSWLSSICQAGTLATFSGDVAMAFDEVSESSATDPGLLGANRCDVDPGMAGNCRLPIRRPLMDFSSVWSVLGSKWSFCWIASRKIRAENREEEEVFSACRRGKWPSSNEA